MRALGFPDHIGKSAVGFTGRAWVFKRIDAWLADPNWSRYFLLTGMPGSGKTAIAARLVQFSLGDAIPADCDQLTTGVLSAWYFCSARDTGGFDPRVFAGTLASQLAARYPSFGQALWQKRYEDRNITITNIQNIGQAVSVTGMNLTINVGNVSPLDAFNRVVREPLMALFAEEPNTRIVILVDALDEALLYGATESIPWLLSKIDSLPKGVRFVLTSRKVEQIEQNFRAATSLFLSAEDFTNYNLEDTRSYVQECLQRNEALQRQARALSGVQVQHATVEMTHKAAGNFLYISFLLESIAKGTHALDQLDGLPKGLDALYFDSLQRVVEQGRGDWHKGYKLLMGILAVAPESLTQAQLEALSGQDEADVWQYLGELLQFFERIDNQGEERYRLYHQSIVDFLSNRWILVERNGAEEKLRNTFYLSLKDLHSEMARRCEQSSISAIWADEQDDEIEQTRREYARKYYIVHLYYGKKEQDRLFSVLDEGAYGRAKIKHDFNPLAYVRDLELGQQATMRTELSDEKKINLLPTLWRYSLLRCSLGTQADNYPDAAFLVMVMLKQYQRVVAALELISDEHRKVRLLINVSVKAVELRQHGLAWQVLLRAKDMLAITMQSGPESIQMALQAVAEVRPFALEAPFLSEIATVAQFIEDEALCIATLLDLTLALVQAEAREKAEALASSIPYMKLDEVAREQIVETLVKAQLWESATLIAQSILDDRRVRNRTLAAVIIGLLEVQQWEKARALALTTDPSDRFKAMAEVALVRVQAEPEMAGELLKELATVSLARNQDDDRQHAKNVTSQIWARAQQWDKAIAIVQYMRNGFWGEFAVSKVLEQMLIAQQWEKALELISSQQSRYQQLEMLDSLVKAFIDTDQEEYIKDTIAKIVLAINQREQHEKEPNSGVVLHAVLLLTRLQYWDDAQQIIEQMKSATHQCQALVALASALLWERPERAGRLILRAESIAFSLKQAGEEAYGSDPERIGNTLCTVVSMLARLHLWDRAIALANTIETRWSTSDRDEAFTAIVAALSQVGIWDRALSCAQNIQNEEEQSASLKAIVEDLSYAQQWQQALEVMQTIKTLKQRYEALLIIINRIGFVHSLLEPPGAFSAEDDPLVIQKKQDLQRDVEQGWDHIIIAVQHLFEEYGLNAIIVELLQSLAMCEQWDRALEIADVPVFVENRAEILVAIVYLMLATQQWERALSLVHTIDVPAQKAETLAAIAASIVEQQPTRAEALLNEALAVVQPIADERSEKSEALALLALQLHKVGRWEKALEIIYAIQEPSERNKALLAIVLARIEIDPEQAITMLNEALAFAQTQGEKDRRQLLSDIVDVLPHLPPMKQTYAFCARFFASMATVLRASEDGGEIAAGLDAFAVAIANAENEEQARAVWGGWKSLANEVERDQIWEPDTLEDLTKNAEAEGSSERRDKLVYSEIWNKLQRGQTEQATTLMLEHMASKSYFKWVSEWSTLQRDVAGSLARKQQWEKALAIAWSIQKSWQKTQTLVDIATTLASAGQREKGQLLLLEAEAVAHTIEKDMDRNIALSDVAEALTEIQELDEAEVVVGFIKDTLKGRTNASSHKSRPRLFIARALARAQRWDEAKEEVQRIGGSLKVSAMSSITDAMIACGEQGQAVYYIQTIWMQAETRRELLGLLALAKELLPLHPELGEACYDAFAWVDRFLHA